MKSHTTRADASLQSAALLACKVAEVQGGLVFAWNHVLRGEPTSLIEYKGP